MHIADLLDDNAGCILGEVIGAAEKLIPLAIAPLSGRPCLHWVISYNIATLAPILWPSKLTGSTAQ